MKIQFSKYHGTGNDFILIDLRNQSLIPDEALVARLCDRHTGIGADGLILLFADPDSDFRMAYFNCDGKESTMCGNGGRCITAFANRLGLIGERAHFSAIDGMHDAEIIGISGHEVNVRLWLKDVVIGSSTAMGTFADTGSPHLVRFMTGVQDLDVVREGRRIRNLKKFAETGINIDFVEVQRDGLFVRTYERGVENETRSCGTGVTASALVSASKFHPSKGFYNVVTRGGTLRVTFEQNKDEFTSVRLEGPAVHVFSGEIEIDEC